MELVNTNKECDFCGHDMNVVTKSYKLDEESRRTKMIVVVEQLGMKFKEVVAKFAPEKILQDTPRELLRIEETMEGVLNPFQITIMERRINQLRKVCTVFKCPNAAFELRVQQLSEIVELKKKQWAYSLSSNLA